MKKLVRYGLMAGLGIGLVGCGAAAVPVAQPLPTATPQITIARASSAPIASSASSSAPIASLAPIASAAPQAEALRYLWPDVVPQGMQLNGVEASASDTIFVISAAAPGTQWRAMITGGSTSAAIQVPTVGTQAVTIRGQQGSAFSTGAGYSLFWQEGGQPYAILSTLSLDDALALANGLHPLDRSAWLLNLDQVIQGATNGPGPSVPKPAPSTSAAQAPGTGSLVISAVVNGEQTVSPTRLKAGDSVQLFVGNIHHAQHATFYLQREQGGPAEALGSMNVAVPNGSAEGGASIKWQVEAGHPTLWLSAVVSNDAGQSARTKPYKLAIDQPAPQVGTITITPSEHSPLYPNDPQAVLVRSGTTVQVRATDIKHATRMSLALKNLSTGAEYAVIGLAQPYPDGTITMDWTVPEGMTEALVRMSAEHDGASSANSVLHVDVAPTK